MKTTSRASTGAVDTGSASVPAMVTPTADTKRWSPVQYPCTGFVPTVPCRSDHACVGAARTTTSSWSSGCRGVADAAAFVVVVMLVVVVIP